VSGTQYGLPLQIETKRLDGDEWTVEGYASTYDLDLGNDAIVPGAFQKSLGNGRPVRFLYQHDHRQVLGKTLDLREDGTGLYGRFAISKTSLGQDVRTHLKDGALDSFSIGYLPHDSEVDKKAGVRRIKEVELIECSLVSTPMNPAALVTGVKELDGNAITQAVAEYVAAAEAKRRNRPIEEVLEEALAEVKALFERRRSEGREPSDRVVAAVAAYRKALLGEADRLSALLSAKPADDDAETEAPAQPEAAAKADPVADPGPAATEARAGSALAGIERARDMRRLLRKFGGVEVPEPDPLAGFERLPILDPLTGEVVT
jgi:HK97 family phage prohead protease